VYPITHRSKIVSKQKMPSGYFSTVPISWEWMMFCRYFFLSEKFLDELMRKLIKN
jgi:hypothetical protein